MPKPLIALPGLVSNKLIKLVINNTNNRLMEKSIILFENWIPIIIDDITPTIAFNPPVVKCQRLSFYMAFESFEALLPNKSSISPAKPIKIPINEKIHLKR